MDLTVRAHRPTTRPWRACRSPTRPSSSASGRVAWTGADADLPADAPEPGARRRRGLRRAGLRRRAHAPDVRRCAPRGVRGPAGRDARTTAAGSERPSTPPPRPATTSCSTSPPGRATEALAHGTTTMEVKTGYGLTARRRAAAAPADRRARRRGRRCGWSRPTSARTSCPPGGTATDYVDEVVATLPAAAAAGARWADVFCDQGVFTVDEARRILTAARDARPRACGCTPRRSPAPARPAWPPSSAAPAPTTSST